MTREPKSVAEPSPGIAECPPSGVPLRGRDLLLMAVWFGLVAGLGETLIVAVQKYALHYDLRDEGGRVLTRHVLWAAPPADVLLFGSIGLMFVLVAWRWPKPVLRRLAALAFAFVAVCSWKMVWVAIHNFAWALLAAGVAMEVSRAIARHPVGFRNLARRTVGWLALMAAGVAVIVFAAERVRIHRAKTALPAAPLDTPNVLLIVLDTVRASNLSVYDYDRPTTPNLERLARSGVRFEWAIAPSPWTLPSHASMFTGRQPHELSTSWGTPLDARYPTLAESFSTKGYLTAGFVANQFYCTRESGLGRGFVHYDDALISAERILAGSYLVRSAADQWLGPVFAGQIRGEKRGSQVTREFLDWVSANRRRPFFAFLNYMEAHDPYLPPKPFQGRFDAPRSGYVPVGNFSPDELPEHARAFQQAYDECLACLDAEVGKILDALKRRGVLERTIVIVVSDHGEQFGEHGLFLHSNSLYLPLLHVPLLISYPPKVPPDATVSQPVSLRDLAATILDLADLDAPAEWPGTSLAVRWREGGSRSPQPLLAEVDQLAEELDTPVAKGDMKAVILGDFHYIRNGDATEELYRYRDDRGELQDLAPRAESQQTLETCRAAL